MTCLVCGKPMPPRTRKHAVTCSGRCRMALLRARRSGVALTPVAPPSAAPGPSQVLCPGCSRMLGEQSGPSLTIRGRWTGGPELWWWTAYADIETRTVDRPVTLVCPSCRLEVAA